MNVTSANLWRVPTLALSLPGFLSGCALPLAYPPIMDSASRREIEASTGDSIEAGKTTRVDVLLSFGEPDGRGIDDSWFSYGSIRVWGVGVTTNGAPLGHQGIDARRMTVRFSPEGVVTKVDFEQRSCSRSGVRWESHPTPCLDPRGSDALTADCYASPQTADKPIAPELESSKAEVLVATGAPWDRSFNEQNQAWQYMSIACSGQCDYVTVWFQGDVVHSVTSRRGRSEAGCLLGSEPVDWGQFRPNLIEMKMEIKQELGQEWPSPPT